MNECKTLFSQLYENFFDGFVRRQSNAVVH